MYRKEEVSRKTKEALVGLLLFKKHAITPSRKKELAVAQCYADCQPQEKRRVIRTETVPESADFLCHAGRSASS